MSWESAATIINDALVELGISSALSDVWASVDPNVVQLRSFLKSRGRQLVGDHEWSHLAKTWTLTTVTGTYSYDLPADLQAAQPNTGWDYTTRLPMGGGLTPDAWAALSARLGGVSILLPYRIMQGKLWFPANMTVPDAHSVLFEYRTRWWASDSGGTTPTKEYPTANDDLVYLSPALMVAALKLQWKKEKGFDTITAQEDFDAAWGNALDSDANNAGAMNITGRSTGVHFLDGDNVPMIIGRT